MREWNFRSSKICCNGGVVLLDENNSRWASLVIDLRQTEVSSIHCLRSDSSAFKVSAISWDNSTGGRGSIMSRLFNETFVAVAADRFVAQLQKNLLQNIRLKRIHAIC